MKPHDERQLRPDQGGLFTRRGIFKFYDPTTRSQQPPVNTPKQQPPAAGEGGGVGGGGAVSLASSASVASASEEDPSTGQPPASGEAKEETQKKRVATRDEVNPLWEKSFGYFAGFILSVGFAVVTVFIASLLLHYAVGIAFGSILFWQVIGIIGGLAFLLAPLITAGLKRIRSSLLKVGLIRRFLLNTFFRDSTEASLDQDMFDSRSMTEILRDFLLYYFGFISNTTQSNLDTKVKAAKFAGRWGSKAKFVLNGYFLTVTLLAIPVFFGGSLTASNPLFWAVIAFGIFAGGINGGASNNNALAFGLVSLVPTEVPKNERNFYDPEKNSPLNISVAILVTLFSMGFSLAMLYFLLPVSAMGPVGLVGKGMVMTIAAIGCLWLGNRAYEKRWARPKIGRLFSGANGMAAGATCFAVALSLILSFHTGLLGNPIIQVGLVGAAAISSMGVAKGYSALTEFIWNRFDAHIGGWFNLVFYGEKRKIGEGDKVIKKVTEIVIGSTRGAVDLSEDGELEIVGHILQWRRNKYRVDGRTGRLIKLDDNDNDEANQDNPYYVKKSQYAIVENEKAGWGERVGAALGAFFGVFIVVALTILNTKEFASLFTFVPGAPWGSSGPIPPFMIPHLGAVGGLVLTYVGLVSIPISLIGAIGNFGLYFTCVTKALRKIGRKRDERLQLKRNGELNGIRLSGEDYTVVETQLMDYNFFSAPQDTQGGIKGWYYWVEERTKRYYTWVVWFLNGLGNGTLAALPSMGILYVLHQGMHVPHTSMTLMWVVGGAFLVIGMIASITTTSQSWAYGYYTKTELQNTVRESLLNAQKMENLVKALLHQVGRNPDELNFTAAAKKDEAAKAIANLLFNVNGLDSNQKAKVLLANKYYDRAIAIRSEMDGAIKEAKRAYSGTHPVNRFYKWSVCTVTGIFVAIITFLPYMFGWVDKTKPGQQAVWAEGRRRAADRGRANAGIAAADLAVAAPVRGFHLAMPPSVAPARPSGKSEGKHPH